MSDIKKPSKLETTLSVFLITASMIGIPLGAIWLLNLIPHITIPYTFLTWVTAYVGILFIEKVLEWLYNKNFLDELNKNEDNNDN